MHSSGKARVQLVFPNKEVIKALGLNELVDCLIGNDAIHRLDQGKAAKALVVTVKYNHILDGSGIKLGTRSGVVTTRRRNARLMAHR